MEPIEQIDYYQKDNQHIDLSFLFKDPFIQFILTLEFLNYPLDPDIPQIRDQTQWEILKLGGDRMKIIAKCTDPEQPYVIKSYLSEAMAKLLFDSYRLLLEEFPAFSDLPLLFPIARIGNILVFPKLEITNKESQKVFFEGFCGSTLSNGVKIAYKLEVYETLSGIFYGDIFEDSIYELFILTDKS